MTTAAAPDSPLKGLHRWITFPSTWSAMLGVAIAVLYAAFTVELTPGTRWQFGGLLLVVTVLANILGDREEQSRLRTLKGLGQGLLPPTREHLTAALTEASRLPEISFWANAGFWGLGSIVVAVGYAVLPLAKWQMGVRLGFIGLTLGPLVSVLALLLVQLRARVVIARVAAAGLTPQEVFKALPPTRFQLRRRLMLFTMFAVLTPMLLICDLAQLRADRTVDKLTLAVDRAAQDQVLLEAQDEGLLPLLTVADLVLLVVVACSYVGGSALGKPMREIALETERIAGGKLGQPTVIPAEDEMWAAASALGAMELQLLNAIGQLRTAGTSIGGSTDGLISSTQKHQTGAGEQTGALAQTSATTEELARSARQIADNASEVSGLAQAMLDSAQGGKRSAGAFYSSILRVRDGNQAIADSVVKLNKRVQQVGRIVEFIDGIADKSDLLALNAELEGTKAGDVGRGFSLVAAEMRRLSETVMDSTREINRLIDEIRDATNAAVMATEAGVKATDAGSGLARQVTESLDRIVEFANLTTDAVKSITLATHQQQAGTDQLAQAMSAILQSTQTSAGATRQMSAATTDLSNLSTELKQTVDRFEVKA